MTLFDGMTVRGKDGHERTVVEVMGTQIAWSSSTGQKGRKLGDERPGVYRCSRDGFTDWARGGEVINRAHPAPGSVARDESSRRSLDVSREDLPKPKAPPGKPGSKARREAEKRRAKQAIRQRLASRRSQRWLRKDVFVPRRAPQSV